MADKAEQVWLWNVDDVWQSFTSMFQEATFASQPANKIERYHHLTAALLFGGCAVEAFLNSRMRLFSKQQGIDEAKIANGLRYTALRRKLEEWPKKMCDKALDSADINIVTEFLELRNEVTHRKREDHSLYKELDEANVFVFVEALQRIMVSVYSGIQKSFSYWLLGWNYVGMNGDETYPTLVNNQQFKHSLRRMGFDVPAWEYELANEWEQKYMTSLEGFLLLRTQVYPQCPDIEPRDDRFPLMPRLCKRWWDKALIRKP